MYQAWVLPAFDSSPFGRLALFFWRTMCRDNKSITSDYYYFRCWTVCKSFWSFRVSGSWANNRTGHELDNYPQPVCLPLCLQCQHITIRPCVTSSMQRVLRRSAAVMGTDSLFAPGGKCLRLTQKTIFPPDQSWHIIAMTTSAVPLLFPRSSATNWGK